MNDTSLRHVTRAHRTVTWLRVLGLLLATGLAACSSGGSGGDSAANAGGTSSADTSTQACGNCGTALMTMSSSSSSSNFLSYIVNIVSLTLTSANGTVVQTVPVTTQVDLAQLVNLSEILSAAQIPAGRYVSAAITLDYSDATIVVNNGTSSGVTIPASEIINGATGNPLVSPNSQVTLTLSLGDNNQLVITPNVVADLALNFNLDASDTISPSTSAPTSVTVNPVLTASLAPDTTRQTRLRGPLVSVNTTAASYVVDVRPFNDFNNTSGQVTVDTSSTTTYSINGTSYTGSAGLTALAGLAAGTLTVTYGSWDLSTQTLTADTVLAGSSVAGMSQTTIEGAVLSISGDTLTLASGLAFRPGFAGMSFLPQVTVTVGSSTSVTEQGQSGTFSTADISVGQQLQVSGTLSTSSGTASLDATSGSALLLPTPLTGTVSAIGTDQVTLNLATLDGRAASSFTFTGTGTSSSTDATAAAYTVAVPSALSTSSLSVGAPASFTGFVAPFGTAPPDFMASTLISYAQASGWLNVGWASPGTTAPFSTLTGSQLAISQATLQSAAVDVVRIAASVTLNPSTLSGGLQLVPDSSATSQTFQAFAIVHRESWNVDNYSSFDDLATALASDLNGTTTALQVTAYGPYDASTGVLSADQLIVVLDD